MREFSLKAGEQWDSKLLASSQIMMKYVPDGITVNGHPKANGVFDTINASM
jgi:hypothetical protein